MDFSVRLAYPVNSNMANHSVDAGDKWHESEASWAPVFCFNMLPQKSLASSMILSVLFLYDYEFLCPWTPREGKEIIQR